MRLPDVWWRGFFCTWLANCRAVVLVGYWWIPRIPWTLLCQMLGGCMMWWWCPLHPVLLLLLGVMYDSFTSSATDKTTLDNPPRLSAHTQSIPSSSLELTGASSRDSTGFIDPSFGSTSWEFTVYYTDKSQCMYRKVACSDWTYSSDENK